MTKLFRDVDYYVVQARNSTQRQFELDFVDVITEYDTHSTELVTEDGQMIEIYWRILGDYDCHFIKETETTLMKGYPGMVEEIVSMLRHIEVDVETLQYIITKVGMSDQLFTHLLSTVDLSNKS